jgi:AcrR family transcriptional regulator
MSETAGTTRRPGRPRSERARQAILRAAADLLLDERGPRVSMDAVAERAAVSKTTIYRWWPSKEMLALDALLDWATAGSTPQDTGSLRGDMLALIRPWVEEIGRRPFGRVIAGLLVQSHADPQIAQAYCSRFVRLRREPMRAALERAIARGETRPDLDLDVALDLIYGPLYHRLLHGHAPLTGRFAEDVVDGVLAGIANPLTAAGA